MKITGHSAESIFDSIRDGIGKGRLPAGSVLPPVRELAEQLGVNRNTVAAAYKRLDAAGLASTAGRRGTVWQPGPAPAAEPATGSGGATVVWGGHGRPAVAGAGTGLAGCGLPRGVCPGADPWRGRWHRAPVGGVAAAG
ncbi:hypothetical protein G6F35_011518 [Rhizopus arrhizus]|nr:hypothetical protein G6F35_011518 [Rhizopus arrhizus]